MATVILDNRSLELTLDGAALALHEAGERRRGIPLKLLDRLVLHGDMRLSASVLTRLAESGVAVLLLSKRHSRRVAIVLGPGHNDAAVRLAQSQLVADADWCIRWARRQVRAKLRGQLRVLARALGARPDCRKALTDATAALARALDALAQGGATLEAVRGVEGSAARAYFAAYGTLFAPSLHFAGRNRRPPKDPVNACLSLAYTLLHFEAVRAAHIAGLDPLLGFYHRPAYGRESLASDLIEPLRPAVDAWVWNIFREEVLRPAHFSFDAAACLLGKAGRASFYKEFEAFVAGPRRMLRRQCQVLARHLRGRGEGLLAADGEDEP